MPARGSRTSSTNGEETPGVKRCGSFNRQLSNDHESLDGGEELHERMEKFQSDTRPRTPWRTEIMDGVFLLRA
jgi:hypothetical protein